MSTDREAHELAAKAAGYTLTWKECHCKGGKVEAPFIGDTPWRPKEDDGDAFRLVRDLKMTIEFDFDIVGVQLPGDIWMWIGWGEGLNPARAYATDKEAIFAAAVAAGKETK
jgi:hypothetical protein